MVIQTHIVCRHIKILLPFPLSAIKYILSLFYTTSSTCTCTCIFPSPPLSLSLSLYHQCHRFNYAPELQIPKKAYENPDAGGRNRYKYFRRPIIPFLPQMPPNVLLAPTTSVVHIVHTNTCTLYIYYKCHLNLAPSTSVLHILHTT